MTGPLVNHQYRYLEYCRRYLLDPEDTASAVLYEESVSGDLKAHQYDNEGNEDEVE